MNASDYFTDDGIAVVKQVDELVNALSTAIPDKDIHTISLILALATIAAGAGAVVGDPWRYGEMLMEAFHAAATNFAEEAEANKSRDKGKMI